MTALLNEKNMYCLLLKPRVAVNAGDAGETAPIIFAAGTPAI